MFYVVYVGDNYKGKKIPTELSNSQFKKVAENQNHVYSIDGLCAEWNADYLPVIDSYVRFL